MTPRKPDISSSPAGKRVVLGTEMEEGLEGGGGGWAYWHLLVLDEVIGLIACYLCYREFSIVS